MNVVQYVAQAAGRAGDTSQHLRQLRSTERGQSSCARTERATDSLQQLILLMQLLVLML
jgi:hypothetical protein